MKNSLFAIALFAWMQAAQASGIALLTPVVFDPDAKVPDSVKAECRLDYQVQTDVLAAMRHYDRQVETVTDASAGRVLKVTITYVLGAGGGAWTGPKVVAVQADVMQDGKVAYSAKMHRRSSLGGGAFRGTCQLLDGASKGLGRRIARWAQHPKTTTEDVEEPDAETSAASDPASAARQ
jgi:hypothetical protein